jgi:two-component system chemotaxis sensor kinase CheA
MNEVIREFLLETHENLAQLDLDLITLEKEPKERETLARVFRTLHTVKGTAGFLGLMKLQAVAHAAENLLSRLRAGELLFNADIASGLLAVVDAIRRMLDALEKTQSEGDGDYGSLIQLLDRLRTGAAGGTPTVVATAPKPAPPAPPTPAPPPPAPVPPKHDTDRIASPPGTTIVAPPVSQELPAAAATEARGPTVADSAVRVDVGLLDKLMTLVGELVLARNQIMQFSSSQENTSFLGTVQRLNRLTTELQTSVLKTRMQPIGNLWSKFPRVVRDLAVACNKQARIDMDGQDTELDRSILEAIRDPLTHLVRNAVDHGIEMPAERVGRGKPAEGRLQLHASYQGGKVIIELVDDGGGIDPKRIAAKAIQSGLFTAEQAQRMSELELIDLIFKPGFSTTEKVTQFSGRGVGMDVVRTNVEKIGGMVNVESRLGTGTTVRMKIPLTLTIIPALMVSTGGDRYAIPQVSLLELIRLDGDQVHGRIEWIHGAPVYRLRGNLLPVVYLHRLLGGDVSLGAANGGAVNMVVLQAEECPFGLIVDEIHDTEEIVVKPLSQALKAIDIFAGATIMGDGKVALILDVLGLAQRGRVLSGARERVMAAEASKPVEPTADRQRVVLCATSDGERIAIPLARVARLEEFPRSSLERVGDWHVVQYRGAILPLVSVSDVLRRKGSRRSSTSAGEGATGDTVPVVVCSSGSGQLGLVVGRILDILEHSVASRSGASRAGVDFTAVVQGRVTEFLDLETIMHSLEGASFDQNVADALER